MNSLNIFIDPSGAFPVFWVCCNVFMMSKGCPKNVLPSPDEKPAVISISGWVWFVVGWVLSKGEEDIINSLSLTY